MQDRFIRQPQQVVDRLLALRALLWRAQLESHAFTNSAPRGELEERCAHLNGWIEASRIALSDRERELLGRDLGAWAPAEIGELVWRNEAAVPLLWALEIAPSIPPFTQPVPAAAVMPRIESLLATADAPRLRSLDEIDRARELALFWNWRARTETFRRRGMPAPPGDSFASTIARAATAVVDSGLVDPGEIAHGDVIVDGAPYSALDAIAFRDLACIAHERHWALSWLTEDADWDGVHPAT